MDNDCARQRVTHALHGTCVQWAILALKLDGLLCVDTQCQSHAPGTGARRWALPVSARDELNQLPHCAIHSTSTLTPLALHSVTHGCTRMDALTGTGARTPMHNSHIHTTVTLTPHQHCIHMHCTRMDGCTRMAALTGTGARTPPPARCAIKLGIRPGAAEPGSRLSRSREGARGGVGRLGLVLWGACSDYEGAAT
jgi:hypothetical protein